MRSFLPLLAATGLLLRPAPAGAEWDALSHAVAVGDRDAVAAALAPGRPLDERAAHAVLNGLLAACRNGTVPAKAMRSVFAELVRDGLDLDGRDQNGNALLAGAAQFCGADVVTVLLELGAAAAPAGNQEPAPLLLALNRGRWDVAAVLVDAGARVGRADAERLRAEVPGARAHGELLDRASRE